MNMICNNCVGARMYEVSGIRFPNPFMWMSVSPDDYVKLVEDYGDLDLSKPVFGIENYCGRDVKSVVVTLENGVNLHYIHYILDENREVPEKENNTDIFYKDIIGYAEKKWFSRLMRSSESPVFVFSFNYIKPDSELYSDVFRKLAGCSKSVTAIIHESVDSSYVPENEMAVVRVPDDVMDLNGSKLAKKFCEIIRFGL